MSNTVNIYGLGGTGTNIVAGFLKDAGVDVPGRGLVQPYFVDTSRSDFTQDIPEDRIFVYEDQPGVELQGSGKLKKSNYGVIRDPVNVNKLLQRFRPGDFNILVHSASGGSGSIIGPVLARALLERGESVIVLVVGTTTSGIDVDNTIGTLSSYETYVVDKLDRPVNLLYRENSRGMPRPEVDRVLHQSLNLLLTLLSGDNHGLDRADVINFLDFQKVTKYKPAVVALDLFAGDFELDQKDQSVISAISITAGREDPDFGDKLVAYNAYGQANQVARESIAEHLPLHAVTITNAFQSIMSRLREQQDLFGGKVKSTKSVKIAAGATTDDDGMAF